MRPARLRLAGPSTGFHPALLGRRIQDLILAGSIALLVLVIALAISIGISNPTPTLVFASLLGTLVVLALMISTRYEVTLSLIVLYLGLLDGPIKLLTSFRGASAVRNVLILAVAIGMLVRFSVSRKRMALTPLSGWVLGFVGAVAIQALNPNTHGILKVVGGFRQELEWVPFFFFGYLMMRSAASFRKLFLLLGVIALANGVVGLYQSRLAPKGLASWGPGYSAQVEGTNGLGGRTYKAEGVGRPRPPALGSDSGFGGGMGVLALPGLLALLSTGRLRRRWVAILLMVGALVGIATAASRSSIVITVIVLIAYAGFSFIGRLPVTRPLIGLLAVFALAVGVGAVLVSSEGSGIFKRQESVTSVSGVETSGANEKAQRLTQIPRDLYAAPFGVGLGTGGAAGGFGGKQKVEIEGSGATKESTYALITLEVGTPGLLLWIGLTINVLLLALLRLRRVMDIEIRTYLVAMLSVYIAFTADGFSGPAIAVAKGAVLWFVPGLAAYWLSRSALVSAASRAIRRADTPSGPAIDPLAA